MKIKINNKITIDKKKPPLIIAEISGNHNGKKSRFLKLIESACKNGADLIKIQTYEPEDITLVKKEKYLKINHGIWKGKYLKDLYKKACTPYNWHKEAFAIAKKYKKIIFSSPFSLRGVDFLETLKVPIYKIASFEITDLNLINYVASKKKPIIISTGMAEIKEIKKAINIIKKYHKKIIILHCVSNYPTKLKDTNLKRINFLKKTFKGLNIGLSDHTNDIYSSIASIALDVCVIEKHYNIGNVKTPDSLFSINNKMLRELKVSSENIYESLNKNKKNKIFKKNYIFRRSIFAKTNIEKNEVISHKNIISLRPLVGIKSEKIFDIIGKKAKNKIIKDKPIFFSDLLS
tara:strand:- start:471 stop:1511 length:1041 start_codon:yes stop_codon:yes gene_type:complete